MRRTVSSRTLKWAAPAGEPCRAREQSRSGVHNTVVRLNFHTSSTPPAIDTYKRRTTCSGYLPVGLIFGINLEFGSFLKSHSWAGYVCFVLLREYGSISVTYEHSCNQHYNLLVCALTTVHNAVSAIGSALSSRTLATGPCMLAVSSRIRSLPAVLPSVARALSCVSMSAREVA